MLSAVEQLRGHTAVWTPPGRNTNGVNGEDLSTFDESALKTELCFTPCQAKKLLAARAAFLIGQVGDGRSGR